MGQASPPCRGRRWSIRSPGRSSLHVARHARTPVAIYSVAATITQFSSAPGPGLYGVLRDLFGGYGPVLAIAAAVELLAMATVLAGRPPPRPDAAAVP